MTATKIASCCVLNCQSRAVCTCCQTTLIASREKPTPRCHSLCTRFQCNCFSCMEKHFWSLKSLKYCAFLSLGEEEPGRLTQCWPARLSKSFAKNFCTQCCSVRWRGDGVLEGWLVEGGGGEGLKVLIQKESGEEVGCGCKLKASGCYLFLTSLHTANYIHKSSFLSPVS